MATKTTTIRKLILGTTFGIIFAHSAIAVPPPEGGFINEAHQQYYTHCENQLRSFDDIFTKQTTPMTRTLRLTLAERLLTLAATDEPKRIRELQEITTGWFDEEGKLKIEGEIPDEIAVEVAAYRSSVARRAEIRDVSKAKEHHWLIRQIDRLALKFEKEGDLETMRKLRTEARSLMPITGLKPTKFGQLEVTHYQWSKQHPPFVRMQRIQGKQELITLARLSGNFAGGGEWVEIQVWDEGGLPGLHANSMQPNVRADAYALLHPALKMDKARVRTESITFGKQKAKLIHHSRGFCYLGGIGGNVQDLTSAEISIDPKDGFYYLSGRFENRSTTIRAVIVEYPEGEAPEFEITKSEWKRGDPERELIAAEDGICLLTGISGALRGEGEEVRLIIDSEGTWRLGGRSNLINTGAKAMVLRFQK